MTRSLVAAKAEKEALPCPLKLGPNEPFLLGMWTYSRQSQFAIMTFTNDVGVEQAYAAAARIRKDVGLTPMRLVIDVADADFPEKCVWIFLAVLEDVPIVDVTLVGASDEATESFDLVASSFAVPVDFHESPKAWLASERSRRRGPRAPTPLLALSA